MADDLDVLPYNSDAYAELDALRDVATGVYVNDATVTVTLYSRADYPVSGATNLPAAYVPGSNGRYRATIPHTAAVKLGASYRCEALVIKGALQMTFTQDVIVRRLKV